jgi:hypothetical protein
VSGLLTCRYARANLTSRWLAQSLIARRIWSTDGSFVEIQRHSREAQQRLAGEHDLVGLRHVLPVAADDQVSCAVDLDG